MVSGYDYTLNGGPTVSIGEQRLMSRYIAPWHMFIAIKIDLYDICTNADFSMLKRFIATNYSYLAWNEHILV